MFRRYHHGHSVALGFLLALAMQQHTLTLVLIAGVVGLVLGRSWAVWALWASALRDKWHLSKRERIATRPTPVYKASAQSDRVPY